MGLDQLVQLSSRRHAIDLVEETVAPSQLLLGGVLEVGKAVLHDRLVTGERAAIVSVRVGWWNARRRINQRLPSGPSAPYFGELGLGRQHQLPSTIQDYLDQGLIRLVERNA